MSVCADQKEAGWWGWGMREGQEFKANEKTQEYRRRAESYRKGKSFLSEQ
jgi:hypothetical protein